MSLSFSADDDDLTPPPPTSRLAPLIIGTALAAVALAGQTKLGAWLRGFLARRERAPRDAVTRRINGGWSLSALRNSMVGRHKNALMEAYGPPRSAITADGTIYRDDACGF